MIKWFDQMSQSFYICVFLILIMSQNSKGFVLQWLFLGLMSMFDRAVAGCRCAVVSQAMRKLKQALHCHCRGHESLGLKSFINCAIVMKKLYKLTLSHSWANGTLHTFPVSPRVPFPVFMEPIQLS